MEVVVTSGLKKACGITRFAERCAEAISSTATGLDVRVVKPKEAVDAADDADVVVVNFEHGVMSLAMLRKVLDLAENATVILHTVDDAVRDALDWISARAKTVALHPYAARFVDEVVLHPSDILYDSVVAPSEVEALGVYGLIRQGKGIEVVMSLARTLGVDKVVARGEVQSEEVLEGLEEFAEALGVEFVVEPVAWEPEDVRADVKAGVLPVVPAVATTHRVIWASGTEADLLGVRVPYIPYAPLGGHNPCAYAIEYGGPTYTLLFSRGLDGFVREAVKFVSRVVPETFNTLARTVLRGVSR